MAGGTTHLSARMDGKEDDFDCYLSQADESVLQQDGQTRPDQGTRSVALHDEEPLRGGEGLAVRYPCLGSVPRGSPRRFFFEIHRYTAGVWILWMPSDS